MFWNCRMRIYWRIIRLWPVKNDFIVNWRHNMGTWYDCSWADNGVTFVSYRVVLSLLLSVAFTAERYKDVHWGIAVTSFHGHFVPSHFVPFYGHFVPNNSHFVPQIVTSFHEIVTSFQSPNPLRFAEEDSRTFSLRNVTGRTEPVDRRTGFNGASVRGLRYARLAGTVLPAEATIALETFLTGSNLLFAKNALRRHREEFLNTWCGWWLMAY